MPYKILSLDGGGTWALIQARALEELYHGKRGHKIHEEFDLVAANSGGSVILAGLAANMTPGEIGNIFDDAACRRKIFHDKGMLTPLLRRFWWLKLFSRYVAEEKLRGLEKSFSDAAQKYRKEGVKFISNAWIQNINREVGGQPDLLITAFDYHSRRARLFRSSMSSEADVVRKPSERCRLLEAVFASSNAPITYFDKPAVVRFFETVEVDGKIEPASFSTELTETDHKHYWDGAIAAVNNPVLVAVTEALANGEKSENIVVLSIGNGTVRLEPDSEEQEKQSWFIDLLKVATTASANPRCMWHLGHVNKSHVFFSFQPPFFLKHRTHKFRICPQQHQVSLVGLFCARPGRGSFGGGLGARCERVLHDDDDDDKDD